MNKKKILFIYGTRPEAIKIIPLIKEFKTKQEYFEVKVCLTGQHQQMIEQTNKFFNIQADFTLNIMSHDQTLFDITSRCLLGLQTILNNKYDLIFVQGDTTSVMAGALAAFYKKIPLAHLEAGLRSYDKYSPFPEEINRIITGHIADFHFAPTNRAVENLKKEGITNNIYMVGNTVIDALYLCLDVIKLNDERKYYNFFCNIDFNKKIILVTSHRRENIGERLNNICKAIASVANMNKNVQFIYILHLNPNIRDNVNRILFGINNVFILEPLDYSYMIWIMNKSYFVMTDSGGLQEEAPALGKPVLILREVTERQESIDVGNSKLIGTKYENIISAINELLENKHIYDNMTNNVNPYGNGDTSKKIVDIIINIFNKKLKE